jgi:hypothetical protein
MVKVDVEALGSQPWEPKNLPLLHPCFSAILLCLQGGSIEISGKPIIFPLRGLLG